MSVLPIEALSHAIRGATIDALMRGTEKATKAGLDAIPLDHAAQNGDKTRGGTKRR